MNCSCTLLIGSITTVRPSNRSCASCERPNTIVRCGLVVTLPLLIYCLVWVNCVPPAEQLLTNLNWNEFPQPAWRGASQYSALMFDARVSSPTGTDLEEALRDVVLFNTTARHCACCYLISSPRNVLFVSIISDRCSFFWHSNLMCSSPVHT